MAIPGTANGQDAARRAALIRYAGGGGGGAAPSPTGAAPAPQAAAGGSVTDTLLSAAHQTVADTQNYQENLGAWKQALEFLKANLPPEALSGQQGAGGQPPISPAMGAGAAQGMPSQYGRPPR